MNELSDSIKRLRKLDAKRSQKSWHKMQGTVEDEFGAVHSIVNGSRGGLLIAKCPLQKKEGYHNAMFIASAPQAIQTINQLVELVAEMRDAVCKNQETIDDGVRWAGDFLNMGEYSIVKYHRQILVDVKTKADALLSGLKEGV